jgi:hypothetical protein
MVVNLTEYIDVYYNDAILQSNNNYVQAQTKITDLQTKLDQEARQRSDDDILAQTKITDLQTKLDQALKSVGTQIIGTSTDLINTGKFVAVDKTKVYYTMDSIKMNYVDSWLYNNVTNNYNILRELVVNNIDSISDNLDESNILYINPYNVEMPTTQLFQTKILYYKSFIENLFNKSLDVEFINNTAASLYYLWAHSHQPNKYYTYSGKNLLIGPNISLFNYNFTESSVDNPLTKLVINSTGNFTFSVESDKNEFYVGTFNGDLYIMSKIDVKYDDYTNKNIKIKLIIDDGVYTYNRVFFITINKMLNSSEDLFAKYQITEDKQLFGYFFDKILGGSGITKQDYESVISTAVVTENCTLMKQLQSLNDAMASDTSLSDVNDKVDSTIASFRSIKNNDDFKSFVNIAKDAVLSGFSKVSELQNNPTLIAQLNYCIDLLGKFIDAVDKLTEIPHTPLSLAVSTFEQYAKNIVIIAYGYRNMVDIAVAGLKSVVSQLANKQIKNVLPPIDSSNDYNNKYLIPSEFYFDHMTYTYYINSDLIIKSTSDDLIGEITSNSYSVFAYMFIKKISESHYNLKYDLSPNTKWFNVSDNTVANPTYELPDTSTKYYLRIDIGYDNNDRLFIKASVNNLIISNIYISDKVDKFEIPIKYSTVV